MRRILFAAILMAAATAHADMPAPPASAPTPAVAPAGDELTVDAAVDLYRQRSARRLAAEGVVDVVSADLVDAQIYPNPSVGVSTTNTVIGSDTIGHTIGQVEVDAPILIGHQRAKRSAAAQARVAVARAELAITRGTDELEIRRRFVTLLAAQQRTAALELALQDVTRVRTIVAGRAAAGAKSPYDVERTELAVATLASRLGQARADQTAAAGELAGAIGVPGLHPRALGEFRPATDPGAATVAADHPAIAAPVAGAAAAVAALAQARADAVPTPSLALAAFGTRSPSGMAVTIGISLPLPLFDKNQGAIARARAQARQAELERTAIETELASALDRADRVLDQRRADLIAFESSAIARVEKVRTMAEDAYRDGQGGIVELLDAHDAILEVQLRDVDLIEAALGAELDVREAAVGR
jgi:cobalt-zinc-cadmium efflux system outer membrane protein